MRTLVAIAFAVQVSSAQAADVRPRAISVAVASNVKLAMEELKSGFESEHRDVRVAVTIGSSGGFFAQLQNGAPFDVFFSGDTEYPKKVVEAGLARAEDEVVYAIGKLVVWAPRSTTLPLDTRGVAALSDPAVKRLAIANPAVAPYGRAAEAALETAGILGAVKGRLVLGQNVSQAAQFAQSGAADAALIPLSLTFSPELRGGRIHPVPESSYPAPRQSAVVLKAARDPELARVFLQFVTGPRGREILSRYGYALP